MKNVTEVFIFVREIFNFDPGKTVFGMGKLGKICLGSESHAKLISVRERQGNELVKNIGNPA